MFVNQMFSLFGEACGGIVNFRQFLLATNLTSCGERLPKYGENAIKKLFDRPGVAGAVLQTASSFID